MRNVQVTGLANRPALTGEDWNSALLEQRIGSWHGDRLRDVISRWSPRIDALMQERTLVHGDFNARNTVLKRTGDRWVVSAILDWEMAFTGSPLWDAARFICYEKRARPCREPHFSRGFIDAGGALPPDWPQLARVINVFTAAEALCRPDVPHRFVPELCDLIAALLDERDP